MSETRIYYKDNQPCPRCGGNEFERFFKPSGQAAYMCANGACAWIGDDRSFEEAKAALDGNEPGIMSLHLPFPESAKPEFLKIAVPFDRIKPEVLEDIKKGDKEGVSVSVTPASRKRGGRKR